MFSKKTFWLAVVALVALGSAAAVPMPATEVDALADEKAKAPESAAPTDTPSTATGGSESRPQSGQEDAANAGETKTPEVDLRLPLEKTDRPDVPSDVELITKPNQPADSTVPPTLDGPYPKPFFPGGARPAISAPVIPPFFLEFFQPFQVPQPPRHHVQPMNPFANQFNPFANSAPIPSFDQLVNSYTNEFRHMLEELEKSMVQMDNVDTTKDGSKPLGKTTTKTEIIDGHVVQTNETTYSDGDDNHKTFYHFKEIKVVPEKPNQKIASSEQTVSTVSDDSESQKEETNEIKPNGPAPGAVALGQESKQNDIQKVDN